MNHSLPPEIEHLFLRITAGRDNAVECVSQLGFVLEHGSFPDDESTAAELWPDLRAVVVDRRSRQEMIRRLGTLLSNDSLRLPALWSISKGNDTECLGVLTNVAEDVLRYDSDSTWQWLIALDTVATAETENKLPEALFSVLQRLVGHSREDASEVAARILRKLGDGNTSYFPAQK